jgi:CheY-like chemotaxis protein
MSRPAADHDHAHHRGVEWGLQPIGAGPMHGQPDVGMVNTGTRVLLADDNAAVRTAHTRLLVEMDGVGSVIAAADGVEALRIGATVPLDIAILDLRMPRLDGVEAAVRLATLQPTISLALHSSDPSELRRRARGLSFALFDKIDFDGLTEWLAVELERRQRSSVVWLRDARCSLCGYGVAVDPPPVRCPMCNRTADWTHVRAPTCEVGSGDPPMAASTKRGDPCR